MRGEFSDPMQQVDRTFVLWKGRKLVYFGGCDYFRLSTHPAVLEAVRTGLDRFGLNVAASRKTTGNHELYEQLENELARFFGTDRAVLTSNGYLTNIVAAQGLRGEHEVAFIDERAHGSLVDAAAALGCRVIKFKHLDATDLERKFARLKHNKGVTLLTDGMFAHSGAVPPLKEYREIIGNGGLLWVDDAHAAGVLGINGRGSLEFHGLERGNTLRTVTLSKAFGAYGGAIACGRRLAALIVNQSSALIGNTPLPLPLANAALTAVQLLRSDRQFKKRLEQNARRFWEGVNLPSPSVLGPVVPVFPESAAEARRLQRTLLNASIYPPYIHYPGGPEAGYFRFALSSEHTHAQIDQLATALRISQGTRRN